MPSAGSLGHLFYLRPRLPLLPARLEFGLGDLERCHLIGNPHAPWLAGSVQCPEPAQRLGAAARPIDAANAPLAAEDVVAAV